MSFQAIQESQKQIVEEAKAQKFQCENIKDIGLVENFLTAQECEDFKLHYERARQLNLTFNRQEGEKVDCITKKDDTFSPFGVDYIMDRLFDPILLNKFLAKFWNAYSAYLTPYGDVVGNASHKINGMRIQETQIGGGYHVWHYEAQGPYADRFAAWMVYFNDVEEGGETEFLRQHIRFKPQAGNLLIWPAGFTHMHRGNPPISNSKLIITGWTDWGAEK